MFKFKNYFFIFVFLLFGTIIIFSAENSEISINEAEVYAKEYLNEILANTMKDQEAKDHFTGVFCTSDIENTNSFFVEGEFNGLLINKQDMSGNFEFNLILIEEINFLKQKKITVDPDNTSSVILKFSENLTDEKKNALILDGINSHYKHPLSKNYKINRQEILDDGIRLYITLVADDHIAIIRADILYSKVKETILDKISLVSTKWDLKQFVEYNKLQFPNQKIIKDELDKHLLKILKEELQPYEGKSKAWKAFSGIKTIRDIEPINSNDQTVRFNIKLDYKYSRIPLFGKQYSCNIEVDFKMEGDQWKLANLNTIDLIDWKILE